MFVVFCLLQECEEHSSCQTEKISGEFYSSFVSFIFLETFQQQANSVIDQISPCPRAGFGRGVGGRKGYLVLLELGSRKLTSVIAFFQSRTVVRWRSVWNSSRSLRHSVKTMPGKRTISTTYTTHMIELVSLIMPSILWHCFTDVSGLIFAFPNQRVLKQNLVSPFCYPPCLKILTPCRSIWNASVSGKINTVLGSLPCSERFFSGYPGFPLSSETNISKFQFDQESGRRRTT